MSSLHAFYDRRARNGSLNTAIVFTVVFSFTASTGLFEVAHYFRQHDAFYLYVAPINVLMGAFGIFHGTQLIHALFRRQAAEQKDAR